VDPCLRQLRIGNKRKKFLECCDQDQGKRFTPSSRVGRTTVRFPKFGYSHSIRSPMARVPPPSRWGLLPGMSRSMLSGSKSIAMKLWGTLSIPLVLAQAFDLHDRAALRHPIVAYRQYALQVMTLRPLLLQHCDTRLAEQHMPQCLPLPQRTASTLLFLRSGYPGVTITSRARVLHLD
jgi:hypothetical protein